MVHHNEKLTDNSEGPQLHPYQRYSLNVLYNYTGRIGYQVVNLFVIIYIIRKLPVDTFGEYNSLLSMMVYVSILTSLGLTNIFQRFLPEFWTRKRIKDIKFVVFWGLLSRTLFGIVIIGTIWIFSQPIGNLIQVPNLGNYLSVYSWVMLITLLTTSLDIILSSLLKQLFTNISLVFYALVQGAGFYYVISNDYGLEGILFVELIAITSRFLILLGTYIIEAHRFPKKISQPQDSIEPFETKRISRYGGWAYLNELGFLFFNTDTDNFIIGNALGQSAVGIYSFANRTATLVLNWSPVTVASNIITPLFFSKFTSSRDYHDLIKMFNQILKILYIFLTPIFIGYLVINEKFVVLLFGENYVTATWILAGILLYQVINAYQYPLGLVVFSIEQNQINFYSRIFSIYNLIAGLLLVRLIGIWGVLIATASAVSFKNLYIYFKITKQVHLKWQWKPLVKITINAIIMGIILWLFRSSITNTLSLILVILLGGVIYGVMTIINRVFTSEEIGLFNSILGNRWHSFKKLLETIHT